jgi:hypothetical protein
VCVKETKISSLSDYKVKSSAHILVDHINGLINKLDKKGLCVTPLVLNSTISAQLLDPPDQNREEMKVNPAVYLRVAIVVSPSGAQLEGIVKIPLLTIEGEVMGEVNRINVYKLQSECVKDSKLKMYCLCKNYAAKMVKMLIEERIKAATKSTARKPSTDERIKTSQSVTTENISSFPDFNVSVIDV